MGGCENFVSRWSRLKRKSEARRKPRSEVVGGAALSEVADESGVAGAATLGTPTVDLASLPSIDSITAETDVSAFLQSGVPAKLAEAALRRVWVSDPVIRDFIEIAENQWDFTNPATIPGFGALRGTGDSLLAQAVGVLAGPMDVLATALPDTDVSAVPTSFAADHSRREKLADTRPAAQAASATPDTSAGSHGSGAG
jgi:Protein of unknown function (DUF3306)